MKREGAKKIATWVTLTIWVGICGMACNPPSREDENLKFLDEFPGASAPVWGNGAIYLIVKD